MEIFFFLDQTFLGLLFLAFVDSSLKGTPEV